MNTSTLFPPTLSLRCGPVTAVDLALFAAASGDHNPLHLDAAVARSAGFDRPVVHGMFTMAAAARLFSEQFGSARVQALQTRFSGVALLGDELCFDARLTEVRDGCGHYALTAATQSGTNVASGTARVGPLA